MRTSLKTVALLALLVASACACLLAAAIPFATVRNYLDSLAGDGSADPYSPELHRRLRIYFACLGVAGLFGTLGLYTVAIRGRISGSSLDRVVRDARQLASETTRFLREHGRSVLLISLLALLIRLPWINQPIRYDEAHSFVHYANWPAYVTIATYADPNNHVFHNLCVHAVTRLLGHSEWAIRLPALIAGVLTVVATYALGNLWGGRSVGWLAALAVAASSPMIEYSVNARGYSLLCLFTLGLLLLAHASLRQPGTFVWSAMALLAALGLWTVPTMAYACAMLLVWLVAAHALHEGSQLARWWPGVLSFPAVAIVTTALLYSPILVVEGPGALMDAGVGSTASWTEFLRGVLEMFEQTSRLLFRDLPWPALLLLVAGWLLALRPSALRSNPAPGLVLLSCGICLLLVLLQRVLPPPRVWLFLLPPMLASSIWGLLRVATVRSPKVRATMVLGIVLVLIAWPLINTVRSDSIRRSAEGGACPDAEEAILWLQKEVRPGEPVIATTPCSAPLVYYALRHGLPLAHFDPPDSGGVRSDTAIVAVPVGGEREATVKAILQELDMETMFALSNQVVVQEFPSMTLVRVHKTPQTP